MPEFYVTIHQVDVFNVTIEAPTKKDAYKLAWDIDLELEDADDGYTEVTHMEEVTKNAD